MAAPFFVALLLILLGIGAAGLQVQSIVGRWRDFERLHKGFGHALRWHAFDRCGGYYGRPISRASARVSRAVQRDHVHVDATLVSAEPGW